MSQKKFFPNIKYCVWHYKRSLEKQTNILCYHEVKNNNDVYIYYKAISNLPFINPNFIFDIYIIIKRICQKKYNNFLQFLEYFNKNYLLKYNVNNWNYYEK